MGNVYVEYLCLGKAFGELKVAHISILSPGVKAASR